MECKLPFLFVLTVCICFIYATGFRRKTVYREQSFLKQRRSWDTASSNGHLSRRKRATRSKCAEDLPLCKCRRRGTVVCTEENCVQNLPTANMTRRAGERITNIIVTKQADFTGIREGDLAVLTNVRSVRFFNNKIHFVSPNAFHFNLKLERLDLHHNRLKFVPNAIRQLSNLRRLNLGGNDITSIPRDIFGGNPKLEHLIFRRNRLETFPALLPRSLVKLTLSQNLISSVADIRYLEHLEKLKLDSNRIIQINSNALPTSIKELSLCSNLLDDHRPLSFNNLKHLRRLRLAGNVNVTHIYKESFFWSANQLKELDLRRCGISVIDSPAFSCLSHLRNIELEGNKLSSYDPRWFANNRNLRRITLSGNPWRCDCSFLLFMSELSSTINMEIVKRASKNPSRRNRTLIFDNDFENITCDIVDEELTRRGSDDSLGKSLNHFDPSLCPDRASFTWSFDDSTCPLRTEVYDNVERSTATAISETPSTTTKSTTTTTTTTLEPVPGSSRPTQTERPTSAPTTSTTTTLKSTTSTTASTTQTTASTTTSATTTTTTTISTTTTAKSAPVRICTKGGVDCKFPFTYDGSIYTDSCYSGYSGAWCYIDEKKNWDYCEPCD